jgi:hypothetical protein
VQQGRPAAFSKGIVKIVGIIQSRGKRLKILKEGSAFTRNFHLFGKFLRRLVLTVSGVRQLLSC